MKFILDNIALIGLALVSGGLLLWPLLRKGGGSTALGPLEATQLINHRNAIVVDVRDEKDFALGSLAGARNIPSAKLAERAGELVRFKSRPVLIVCDAGQQSAKAIATFTGQGFEAAHSLAGGLSAWKQAGLPLVQPGRDTTRVAVKEGGRKSRNERGGERARAARAARDGVPVVAPPLGIAANEEPLVAVSATAPAPVGAAPFTPSFAAPAAAAPQAEPSVPQADTESPAPAPRVKENS